MTITLKIPQPDTEERLVLVPPGTVSPTYGERGTVLTIHTDDARDATPADLERGGYVPLAAFVGPLDLLSPPTLAGALEAIEGIRKDADRWEYLLSEQRARVTSYLEERDEAVARAEKAERERDEARRLHSAAEAQVACRSELRAQVAAAEVRFREAEAERDTLRAEVARLTASGEGSEGGPWRAYGEPTDQELVDAFEHAYRNAPSVRTHATAIRTLYRLGVAHERARHVEKNRATDEELFAIAEAVYEEAHGGDIPNGPHEIARRVAARVRQERCLVAQAVGMWAGVTASRTSERVPGTTGMWDVYVTRRPDVPGEHYAYGVPTADVPATLARLLGEVSR